MHTLLNAEPRMRLVKRSVWRSWGNSDGAGWVLVECGAERIKGRKRSSSTAKVFNSVLQHVTEAAHVPKISNSHSKVAPQAAGTASNLPSWRNVQMAPRCSSLPPCAGPTTSHRPTCWLSVSLEAAGKRGVSLHASVEQLLFFSSRISDIQSPLLIVRRHLSRLWVDICAAALLFAAGVVAAVGRLLEVDGVRDGPHGVGRWRHPLSTPCGFFLLQRMSVFTARRLANSGHSVDHGKSETDLHDRDGVSCVDR